jgi:hypothetical protein
VLLSSVLVLLLAAVSSSEEYSNVASVFDLGMGARPLAMGGAFVGLADDGSTLFYNPAGLAWSDGLSALSSVEIRPSTASYGHVSACLGNLGVGMHYFDFGEVSETDEFGNVIGTFSYRNYGLLAGTGVSAASIPFLSGMNLAECIAFGVGAKLLIVDTLDPGDGSGFATDLSFLLKVDDPWFGKPYLTRLSFGVVVQNLFGTRIAFESGHREDWQKKVAIGISTEVLEQLVASLEVRSTGTVHFGLEWFPVPAIALRCGLKRDGVWMWSLGMGVYFGRSVFDYALVIHPVLNNQHRGSLTIDW